jgi:hypothetical protein
MFSINMRQSFVLTHLQSQRPCFFLQLGPDFVAPTWRGMSAPSLSRLGTRSGPLRSVDGLPELAELRHKSRELVKSNSARSPPNSLSGVERRDTEHAFNDVAPLGYLDLSFSLLAILG